jgi:hypothetical protein
MPLDPSKMTDEELLSLFNNASRLISENKNVAAANSTIATIEAEWEKRARAGQPQSNSYGSPAVGMLATLGYHVGSTTGERKAVRRRILKHVMEGFLPLVGTRDYTEGWGPPNSKKRHWKLTQVLESQRNNPANKDKARAIIEWSEDLAWVQQNYEYLSN